MGFSKHSAHINEWFIDLYTGGSFHLRFKMIPLVYNYTLWVFYKLWNETDLVDLYTAYWKYIIMFEFLLFLQYGTQVSTSVFLIVAKSSVTKFGI